ASGAVAGGSLGTGTGKVARSPEKTWKFINSIGGGSTAARQRTPRAGWREEPRWHPPGGWRSVPEGPRGGRRPGGLRPAGGGGPGGGRAGVRACPKPRKESPDLVVDEAERLPPPPDLREQLGAVAAHLLRRLPRVEHLLEQSEHLGVAGHRCVSSGYWGVARRLRGPARRGRAEVGPLQAPLHRLLGNLDHRGCFGVSQPLDADEVEGLALVLRDALDRPQDAAAVGGEAGAGAARRGRNPGLRQCRGGRPFI